MARFYLLFTLLLIGLTSLAQTNAIEQFILEVEKQFEPPAKTYPDTFLVNYYFHETEDIYFQIRYDSLSNRSKRDAYQKKDSSAFNGTIIIQSMENNYYEAGRFYNIYIRRDLSYENGRFIRSNQKRYIRSSKIQDLTKHDMAILFDHKNYGYHLVRENSSYYEKNYFAEGLLYSMTYTFNTDTSLDALFKSIEFYESGAPKKYHMHEVKDSIHYEIQLVLSEKGDTIDFEYWIDLRRNGLCIDKVETENHNREIIQYELRTTWKNDTLLDVLNSDILFVDEKLKVISEEAFCSILYHDINKTHWIARPIPESLIKAYKLPYKMVFSCNPEFDYFFLQSRKRKISDLEVIQDFLDKNKKRIKELKRN